MGTPFAGGEKVALVWVRESLSVCVSGAWSLALGTVIGFDGWRVRGRARTLLFEKGGVRERLGEEGGNCCMEKGRGRG